MLNRVASSKKEKDWQGKLTLTIVSGEWQRENKLVFSAFDIQFPIGVNHMSIGTFGRFFAEFLVALPFSPSTFLPFAREIRKTGNQGGGESGHSICTSES